MRFPRRGWLIAALITMLLALSPPAHAGTPLLHQGSHGKRVAALQWLLSSHRPSKFEISTFHYKPNGLFGKRTAAAVVEMKARLGFPARALTPTAGSDLFNILTGKTPRPLGYLNRATKRLAAADAIAADHASSACAQKLIATERGEIGVHEQPLGSNWGSRVREYLDSVGINFPAPWCAAFQAWAYRLTHVGFPRAWDGYIANTKTDQAGVFAIVRSAHARGWLRAVPKPGNAESLHRPTRSCRASRACDTRWLLEHRRQLQRSGQGEFSSVRWSSCRLRGDPRVRRLLGGQTEIALEAVPLRVTRPALLDPVSVIEPIVLAGDIRPFRPCCAATSLTERLLVVPIQPLMQHPVADALALPCRVSLAAWRAAVVAEFLEGLRSFVSRLNRLCHSTTRSAHLAPRLMRRNPGRVTVDEPLRFASAIPMLRLLRDRRLGATAALARLHAPTLERGSAG
jgi:hypothetical protein